jgi:phosphatidylserine/phosphatidylglycerophosphate/cardiolipin synthase-like enzyme
MSVALKVYTNEDDALIYWSVPAAIPGCLGFAIRRRIRHPNGTTGDDYLLNRVGFEGESAAVTPESKTKTSDQWPFQRFSWTDHDADTGDEVSYRVIPVVRDSAGNLKTVLSQASGWSTKRILASESSNGAYKPYFNRGFVLSQFMARYLKQNNLTLEQFKRRISNRDDRTIRTFLSGDLRLALLKELKTAKDAGTDIFAALFELSDDELIDALVQLGPKAHVVLANGSVDKAGEDENASSRKALLDAHVDVEEHNRFIGPNALGHNKFMVRTDAQNKAVTAWTGSTNWAPTGLCTQVNNGLLIEDPVVANNYLVQWGRLRRAGSDFPTDTLVGPNSSAKTSKKGTVSTFLWFSRTQTKNQQNADLEALRDVVAKAKFGILFLMFQPGATGILGRVAQRGAEPGMFVRGVVSELPSSAKNESAANILLLDGIKDRVTHLDIVRPEGEKANPFANFAAEVTHNQFRANVGFAIIHSKVLVVDPFSNDPVVVTGSHNFSISASQSNDENFIIIRGDKKLAEAYAVNVLSAYAHYRWRAYLGEKDDPFHGLKTDDSWMAPRLTADAAELRFWGV